MGSKLEIPSDPVPEDLGRSRAQSVCLLEHRVTPRPDYHTTLQAREL